MLTVVFPVPIVISYLPLLVVLGTLTMPVLVLAVNILSDSRVPLTSPVVLTLARLGYLTSENFIVVMIAY